MYVPCNVFPAIDYFRFIERNNNSKTLVCLRDLYNKLSQLNIKYVSYCLASHALINGRIAEFQFRIDLR